jgi:transposase
MAKATEITVSPRQWAILEGWTRKKASTPHRVVERARLILMSAQGVCNVEQGRRLRVDRQRARRWRRRWAESQERLDAAEREGASDKDLTKLLHDMLSDRERSGTPGKFTAEQLTQIIGVACELPTECNRPVTHWTPKELAAEVIKRGIVASISPRHIDRFLKEADLRPHKSQYWLTSKDKLQDPEQYEADVRKVCATYADAPSLEREGAHVVSTDEKTSIQAIQRLHETLPSRPGKTERVEFEYLRHGTLCLTNFDVVLGKVIEPTISSTRTETDFSGHIERTIDTDPTATWIFVLDQLNTHKSEALVKLVASRCGITSDLGIKGETGVLKTMESRKQFLEDPSHQIRFVYTPRHASWLNQVEIWFSILARRALKRASFASVDALRERLNKFIAYFNAVLAKPFRWTYAGKPLQAAA